MGLSRGPIATSDPGVVIYAETARAQSMKRLRILALMHEDCVAPAHAVAERGERVARWNSEQDVLTTLSQLGHHVQTLGVATDLGPIRAAVAEFRPHVVFNLLEEFHGETVHVPYVVGYLQLLGQAFTR